MNKYLITFGSNQLHQLHGVLNPMKVMIVVEADNEGEARSKIMESFIGPRFCTSYPYKPYAKEFAEKYNMKEYSLKQIEDMVREQNVEEETY